MKYNHEKAKEIVKLVDPENQEYKEIKSQLNQYFYVGDYLKELSLVFKERFSDIEELKQAVVATSEILYEVIMKDDAGWIDVDLDNSEFMLREIVKGLTDSLDYQTNTNVSGYLQEVYGHEF